MTAIPRHRRHSPRAPGSCAWRIARRAARALREIHREQMYFWECFWRAGRAAVPRPGPLAWTLTLDGYRLTGSYLPGPDAGPHQGEAPGNRHPAPSARRPGRGHAAGTALDQAGPQARTDGRLAAQRARHWRR